MNVIRAEEFRGTFALLLLRSLVLLASCAPSGTAWAESAHKTATPSVTDAGAPTASKPPEHKASRRPPKLPHSPRLACSKDSDCAIVYSLPCRCEECGTSWHEVLNKRALHKLQASWARKRCAGPACPKCERHLLGTKAICRAGQCTIE